MRLGHAPSDNKEGAPVGLEHYQEVAMCRNNEGFFDLERPDCALCSEYRTQRYKDQLMNSFVPLEYGESWERRIDINPDCEVLGFTVIVISEGEVWCNQLRLV